MKKIAGLLICLFSLNVLADQCQEEKLIAQIKYEELFSQFGMSKRNHSRAENFIYDIRNLRDKIFYDLTSAQQELFKLNFKKALAVPEIKKIFEKHMTIRPVSGQGQQYYWINDHQAWVCRIYLSDENYSTSASGLAGNAYCGTLTLPKLELEEDNGKSHISELIKRVTYVHNGSKKNPAFTKKFGELDLNLSKEEYIKQASAPYCKQAVATDGRQSEIKVADSASEIKEGNSAQK